MPSHAVEDRPQTVSSKLPVSLELKLLGVHATDEDMHLHRSSFGVGGRFGETFQVELAVGHAAAAVFVGL